MTHDLEDFILGMARQINDEYKRIQKRATEDPGTAGDQGEENWASLLRNWLPHTVHVVTKGRILSEKGVASPQVDVIVLSPEYPKQLLDKKLYLAGGVLAAFECKITLKSKHIQEFINNSKEIKQHVAKQKGTPYKELHSTIIYGLLAHSHSWKKGSSTTIDLVTNKLMTFDEEVIEHPFEMPDIICIADLNCWTTSKLTYLGPNNGSYYGQSLKDVYGDEGCAISYYNCSINELSDAKKPIVPIGAFIYSLTYRLSRNLVGLRPLASYYANVFPSAGKGVGRKWPITIYSDEIRAAVFNGYNQSLEPYSEWSFFFY